MYWHWHRSDRGTLTVPAMVRAKELPVLALVSEFGNLGAMHTSEEQLAYIRTQTMDSTE